MLFQDPVRQGKTGIQDHNFRVQQLHHPIHSKGNIRYLHLMQKMQSYMLQEVQTQHLLSKKIHPNTAAKGKPRIT